MPSRLAKYQTAIFSCMFIGYAFYVLCRKAFGFIIPTFLETEDLNKEDLGVIVSSLNTAYAISKFIIGVLSDQISARVLLSMGLACCGATLLGFSQANSVSIYTLLWFMNGLGQGCGWPACAKLLRKWFKPSQLGTMWSLLSASMNVTGAVVPWALPFLLTIGHGWRGFMLIAGVASVVVGLLSFMVIRDEPSECAMPNMTSDQKKDDKKKDDKSIAKWSALLSSAFLWRLSFYYFVVFLAKTSCENWAQLLILEEKKLSRGVANAFVSSFEIGGLLSSFTTGYITDWVINRQASTAIRSNPRMKVVTIYMLVITVGLAASATLHTMLPVTSFILGACLYGNINIFGIVATEEAPVHLSGSSHAVVALAANVGAILAGYPFSILSTHTSLSFAFLLQSGLSLACVLLLIFTRSRSTKIAHVD